jgi:hypothetical protein
MALTDELLAHLKTQVDGRYFGKFRAVVTDNADPLDIGRIKAAAPVLGDLDTGWALPAFPYGGISEQGFFFVPDVGANVWIEFEYGDPSYPIWTGVFFSPGDVPESAKPAQKVIKTQAGHKVILDDDAGTVEITDSNGNTIKMDSSTINVTAGQATKIVIDAPQIELVQGASHPLVFGDDLLQYLNQVVQTYSTHTHPGQMAGPVPVSPMPPTPPLSPPTPSLLSQKVKTG